MVLIKSGRRGVEAHSRRIGGKSLSRLFTPPLREDDGAINA
jgi:hypothetical protein